MNLFVLDNDPVKAAQMMCNRHVVKMILETRDLLLLATLRLSHIEVTHRYKNHPITKWLIASYKNYIWAYRHGEALCDEYTYRYSKVHMFDSFFRMSELVQPESFSQIERTPFVQCMLPEYFDEDPVQAYRNYYMGAKTHLLKYTRRAPPEWMQALELGEHRDNATI